MGDERIDPRLIRSRDRILSVAAEILRSCGAVGLTIDAVAARSGVAKTTIYRQFADRDELHMAVIDSIEPAPSIGAEGDLLTDVRTWTHEMVGKLRSAGFGLVPSMIEAAERSERAAELARACSEQRRAVLVERIARAIQEGELPAGTDVDVLVGQLVGPLFYRRFISRQELSAAFVDRLVDDVLGPRLSPRARRRAPASAGHRRS